jgi:hypothetical protein
MDYDKVKNLIKSYPDFPKPGILFRDIHPVMFNADARDWVLSEMVKRYKGPQFFRFFNFFGSLSSCLCFMESATICVK